MKTYEDYMYFAPMTDGEEIRSFLNDKEEEDDCKRKRNPQVETH